MLFDIRRATLGGYQARDVVQAFRIERSSLLFALRTTLAAFLALGVGHLLHFQDFYWAGVTAWVMALPGRGVVFQKAGYRAAGTVIGAAVAFLFLQFAHLPVLLVFLMGCWVGVCGFVASRYRRFQAYSAQLSGYTCTIVCIVAFQVPADMVTALAPERVALVFVGLACSTLLAWALASKIRPDTLLNEARDWAANSAKWASDILRQAEHSDGEVGVNHRLWTGLSEFENTCVQASFESRKVRRRLPAVREFVSAQVSLLSAVRSLARLELKWTESIRREVADHLHEASSALRRSENADTFAARLHQLSHELLRDERDMPDKDGRLAAVSCASRCRDIATFLQRVSDGARLDPDGITGAPGPAPTHHDWQVSLSGGLRTAISTIVMGLLWVKFDWPGGSYAFVLTPVACLLFGTVIRPDLAMQRFAMGIVGMATIFVVWNVALRMGAATPAGALPFLMAMTFIAAIGLSRRFTPAMDFNTNLTALMLGAADSPTSLPLAIEQSAGVVLGMAISYVAFALPPDTASWRVKHVPARLLTMLEGIAKGEMRIDRTAWEARVCDIVSVISAEMRDKDAVTARESLRKCLLAMDMGIGLIRLRELSDTNTLAPKSLRVARQALRSLATDRLAGGTDAQLQTSIESLVQRADATSCWQSDDLNLCVADSLELIRNCLASWRQTSTAEVEATTLH
jgi:uncharacterized membrane protein YccC